MWRALLESAAAEHGARMAAMDAATNNAGEMIDRLTLYMNKVRQAAITKEIIEVVSGAGAGAQLNREQRIMATENVGRVVQIIGPVVDVEFDDGRARRSTTRVRIQDDGAGGGRADRRDRRGGAAPGREPRALRRHAAHRRHGARHEGRRHRRPHHGAGRARAPWAGC